MFLSGGVTTRCTLFSLNQDFDPLSFPVKVFNEPTRNDIINDYALLNGGFYSKFLMMHIISTWTYKGSFMSSL